MEGSSLLYVDDRQAIDSGALNKVVVQLGPLLYLERCCKVIIVINLLMLHVCGKSTQALLTYHQE